MNVMQELGLMELFSRELREDTFVLRKPGCSDQIYDEFIEMVRGEALTISRTYKIHFNTALYNKIFEPVLPEVCHLMTSEPIDLVVLSGSNAIFRARWAKRLIRAKYHRNAHDIENFIHSSDSPREIALLAAELNVPISSAADMDPGPFSSLEKENVVHVAVAAAVAPLDGVASAFEHVRNLRFEGSRTAFALGISLPELSAVVFPHPFDYDQLIFEKPGLSKIVSTLATNDAIVVHHPLLDEGARHDDDAAVREVVHNIRRMSPLANAIIYSAPDQRYGAERVLERVAHVSDLALAAGSMGSGLSFGTSQDKFRLLAERWKIY